jgi:hypothetical protein
LDCADTKLLASFYISDRSYGPAKEFIGDLSERLSHRIQLTSDGHKSYAQAVLDAFGNELDYAMLIRKYGKDYGGSAPERRYSPAVCIGIGKELFSEAPTWRTSALHL